MSSYPNRLQPALQNLLQHVVWFFHPRLSCSTHLSVDVCGGRKSLVKPVTWQNISNCSVLSPEIVCTTTHISADVQRITLNASCMTISGERTEQLDIFCRVTGFTSDFLSFIDVELIRFFHGALQFTHFILSAIFVGEPGLDGCPLNSHSPFILELCILLGQA